MTKIEIICVIGGLIAFLYPFNIKVKSPVTLADVLVTLAIIIRFLVCGLLILLPLYFRFWRR